MVYLAKLQCLLHSVHLFFHYAPNLLTLAIISIHTIGAAIAGENYSFVCTIILIIHKISPGWIQ